MLDLYTDVGLTCILLLNLYEDVGLTRTLVFDLFINLTDLLSSA